MGIRRGALIADQIGGSYGRGKQRVALMVLIAMVAWPVEARADDARLAQQVRDELIGYFLTNLQTEDFRRAFRPSTKHMDMKGMRENALFPFAAERRNAQALPASTRVDLMLGMAEGLLAVGKLAAAGKKLKKLRNTFDKARTYVNKAGDAYDKLEKKIEKVDEVLSELDPLTKGKPRPGEEESVSEPAVKKLQEAGFEDVPRIFAAIGDTFEHRNRTRIPEGRDIQSYLATPALRKAQSFVDQIRDPDLQMELQIAVLEMAEAHAAKDVVEDKYGAFPGGTVRSPPSEIRGLTGNQKQSLWAVLRGSSMVLHHRDDRSGVTIDHQVYIELESGAQSIGSITLQQMRKEKSAAWTQDAVLKQVGLYLKGTITLKALKRLLWVQGGWRLDGRWEREIRAARLRVRKVQVWYERGERVRRLDLSEWGTTNPYVSGGWQNAWDKAKVEHTLENQLRKVRAEAARVVRVAEAVGEAAVDDVREIVRAPGKFAVRLTEKELKAREIGGVELNYAEHVTLSPKLRNARLSTKNGRLRLRGTNGSTYSVAGGVDSEMLDTFLMLRQEVRDVSQLAFTLDLHRDDVRRASTEASRKVPPGTSTAAGQLSELRISVPNHPRYLGADFGSTIVGRVTLDADLALKRLVFGRDPAADRVYAGSRAYKQAVADLIAYQGALQTRFWLYLKSAQLDVSGDNVTVHVTVGVKTKSVEYLTDDRMVDRGASPGPARAVAAALEADFDSIAARVPSWAALREVYRALVVVHVLDAMGVAPAPTRGAEQLRRYRQAITVPGLVGFTSGRAGYRVVVGGVDMSVFNRNNQVASARLRNKLTALARRSRDPMWRAYAALQGWQLDRAIREAGVAIGKRKKDPRGWLLRGNARAAKLLQLAKPAGSFDPYLLQTMISSAVTRRFERSLAAIPTLESKQVVAARNDLQRGYERGALEAAQSRAALDRLLALPASAMVRRAAASNSPSKMRSLSQNAAKIFMRTGQPRKAADRYAYLTTASPGSFGLQRSYARALIEAARSEIVPAAHRRTVAIMPFADSTSRAGSAWLGTGLAGLLGEALRYHEAAAAVAHADLRTTSNRLGMRGPLSRLTAAERLRLALEPAVAAEVVVSGTFTKMGPSVKLSLTLVDLQNSRTKQVRVVGSLARVQALVRDVSDEISTVAGGPKLKPTTYPHLPSTPETTRAWSQIRHLALEGKSDQDIAKAVLTGPGDAARLELAAWRISRGSHVAASQLLQVSAQRPVDEARRQFLLAITHGAAGRFAKARTHIAAACRRQPTSIRYWRMYRTLMEPAQRGAANERLVALGVRWHEPYVESAIAQLLDGRRTAAMATLNKYLEQARATDPGLVEVARLVEAIR